MLPQLRNYEERYYFYVGAAFLTSFLFAPLSWSVVLFFIFVAVYQAWFWWYHYQELDWLANISIILASILGYAWGWSIFNEGDMMDEVWNCSIDDLRSRCFGDYSITSL